MDESGGLTRGSFPGSFPAAAAPCRSAAGLGGLVESRPELRTELSRPRAGVHRIPWQQAIIRSQWLSHRTPRPNRRRASPSSPPRNSVPSRRQETDLFPSLTFLAATQHAGSLDALRLTGPEAWV